MTLSVSQTPRVPVLNRTLVITRSCLLRLPPSPLLILPPPSLAAPRLACCAGRSPPNSVGPPHRVVNGEVLPLRLLHAIDGRCEADAVPGKDCTKLHKATAIKRISKTLVPGITPLHLADTLVVVEVEDLQGSRCTPEVRGENLGIGREKREVGKVKLGQVRFGCGQGMTLYPGSLVFTNVDGLSTRCLTFARNQRSVGSPLGGKWRTP